MSQGPLCPHLSQKVQKEVSQMVNRNLSPVILLGGLSVNLNHLKTYNFTYFNMLILCMLLQIINKGKVTPQGHIKVKVKISIPLPILCSPYC